MPADIAAGGIVMDAVSLIRIPSSALTRLSVSFRFTYVIPLCLWATPTPVLGKGQPLALITNLSSLGNPHH